MLPLFLFIALGLTILVLFEWRTRRQSAEEKEKSDKESEERIRQNIDGECCGQHLVCEKEQTALTPVDYYDDEELDAYAYKEESELSQEEAQAVREVFRSLNEKDVTGWVKSVSKRHIPLPDDVREEALMIVREQRAKAGKTIPNG